MIPCEKFKKKNKHHLIRPYPTSDMSLNDYKAKGSFFITIERDKDSSVKSMMKRAGQNRKQAESEWEEQNFGIRTKSD